MVRSGGTYPPYRYGGRFFGRRLNCEHVPMLPAQVVAWMLDDPRKIPYLLVWKSRSNGTAREAVRIAACNETNCPDALYWLAGVEIKRHDGTCNFIRTMLRRLPRNGGSVRLLICPYCSIPRRGLYGWKPGGRFSNSVVRSTWGCRKCSGLRFASEGGALLIRPRGTLASYSELVTHRDQSPGSLTCSPQLKRRWKPVFCELSFDASAFAGESTSPRTA